MDEENLSAHFLTRHKDVKHTEDVAEENPEIECEEREKKTINLYLPFALHEQQDFQECFY